MLKKFEQSDVFVNRIKAYPKVRIFTHSGSMYYNDSNSGNVYLNNFLSQELQIPVIPVVETLMTTENDDFLTTEGDDILIIDI